MRQKANGINMLDVKRRNRGSILNLIYRSNGISRKDIANNLGLTPAAITLITNDLIQEGIISESSVDQVTNRKGRKEIFLEINCKKYAAVGIYITRHKFRILCIDLENTVIFEDTIYTADCHKKSELILNKLCDTLRTYLKNYDVLRTRELIGLGISVNGIVDTRRGISVRSYNVWERNVPVAEYLEEKLHLPVLLTNNICSLAHGECFLSHMEHPDDMLFIKYGPGVGAARLSYEQFLTITDFKAIQLGHTIADPNGAPCVCGNSGCLETIASYDSIETCIGDVMSKDNTPHLLEATLGNPSSITMEHVVAAYDAKDPAVVATVNRSIYYLALAIKNAICLFDPKTVVLYGELFENANFRQSIYQQLARYPDTNMVSFSHYNLELETLGPATTIIQNFFQNGGKL